MNASTQRRQRHCTTMRQSYGTQQQLTGDLRDTAAIGRWQGASQLEDAQAQQQRQEKAIAAGQQKQKQPRRRCRLPGQQQGAGGQCREAHRGGGGGWQGEGQERSGEEEAILQEKACQPRQYASRQRPPLWHRHRHSRGLGQRQSNQRVSGSNL